MIRTIRYLIYMLLALALLLLVAPMFISSDQLKKALNEHGQGVGLSLEAGSIALQLLPRPELNLEDVKISSMSASSGQLSAQSGAITLQWMPLLQGQLVTDRIDLSELMVSLPRHNSGTERALQIDHLSGQLLLDQQRLLLKQWSAELYGGAVTFVAEISHQQGLMQTVRAEFKASGIQAAPLLTAVGSRHQLSGTLSGELTLAADGSDSRAMMQGLKIDGPVRIRSGKLTVNGFGAGYDLMRCQWQTRGINHHLNHLEIFSPLINATGELHVSAGNQLRGRIRTTGLSGEVMVAGTVAHPQLIPVSQPMAGSQAPIPQN